MGHILCLFTYLLTYYFRFRSGTRVINYPDAAAVAIEHQTRVGLELESMLFSSKMHQYLKNGRRYGQSYY